MNLLNAILYLVPDAQCVITGDDYKGLQWLDDRPKPTLQQLEVAEQELIKVVPKNWDLLVQKFLGSQIYMQSFYMSKESLAIAQSFNKLEQVVLITRIEPALAFFLQDLRQELGESVTEGEITEVNQILTECGFGNIQLERGAING